MAVTVEQLVLATRKSFENAESLLRDAEILFGHERYSRCLFLCCIAGEELGKAIYCMSSVLDLFLDRWTEKRDELFWRSFRAHRFKTALLHSMEEVYMSRHETTWNEAIKTAWSERNVFEEMKLNTLYADFQGEHVLAPDDFFATKIEIELYVTLTRNRVESFRTGLLPTAEKLTQTDPSTFKQFVQELIQKMTKEREDGSEDQTAVPSEK
jgi:AbiV family abortive infection protein